MAEPEWTRWYKFSEVYHHHGWITDKRQSKYRITIENNTGTFHTDGGFRLKSEHRPGCSFSDDDHDPKDEVTCPLKRRDLGLYWIHIKSHIDDIDSKDYIGMSTENNDGIRGRLNVGILAFFGIWSEPINNISWDTLVTIEWLSIAMAIGTIIIGYIASKDDEKDNRISMTGMVLATIVLILEFLGWFWG